MQGAALTFRIHSPSDGQPLEHLWRDSYVKSCLAAALTAQGHSYEPSVLADTHIYVHGWLNGTIDARKRNVLWVIGHPDALIANLAKSNDAIKKSFSRILVASRQFQTTLLKDFGILSEWVACPPPERLPPDETRRYELAFVGNADPAKNRQILAPILHARESILYGTGWKGVHGWMGDYTPWETLHNVWSAARLVPMTIHEDMRKNGFVSDATLDIMANSTALCLPQRNPGLADLGLDAAPQWDNENDLKDLITHFLENEPERQSLAAQLKRQARRFTYEYVAERIMEVN